MYLTDDFLDNYYLEICKYNASTAQISDVYYSKNARIPKTSLFQMAKLSKKGILSSTTEGKCPFEATLYVYNIQKGESIEDLVNCFFSRIKLFCLEEFTEKIHSCLLFGRI